MSFGLFGWLVGLVFVTCFVVCLFVFCILNDDVCQGTERKWQDGVQKFETQTYPALHGQELVLDLAFTNVS